MEGPLPERSPGAVAFGVDLRRRGILSRPGLGEPSRGLGSVRAERSLVVSGAGFSRDLGFRVLGFRV